jgi:hypothetical protein
LAQQRDSLRSVFWIKINAALKRGLYGGGPKYKSSANKAFFEGI